MILLRGLRKNDLDDFKNYLRMDGKDFNYLLKIVDSMIKNQSKVVVNSLNQYQPYFHVLKYTKV